MSRPRGLALGLIARLALGWLAGCHAPGSTPPPASPPPTVTVTLSSTLLHPQQAGELRIYLRDANQQPLAADTPQVSFVEADGAHRLSLGTPVPLDVGAWRLTLRAQAGGAVGPLRIVAGAAAAIDTAPIQVRSAALDPAASSLSLAATATPGILAAGQTVGLEIRLVDQAQAPIAWTADDPALALRLQVDAAAGLLEAGTPSAQADGSAALQLTALEPGEATNIGVWVGGQLLQPATGQPRLQVVAGPATQIGVDAGGGLGLVGRPGETLGELLQVVVRDRLGHGVAQVPVAWSLLAADGQLTPSGAATDALGRASAAWTLGSTPGAQVARASCPAGSQDFVAQATASWPRLGSALLQAGATAVADGRGAASLELRLQDDQGQPWAGVVPKVSLAAATGSGQLRLRAADPTDALGRSRLALVGPQAGDHGMRLDWPAAADGAAAPAAATATLVAGRPAAAHSSLVAAEQTPPVADDASPHAFVLQLSDADGNPLALAPTAPLGLVFDVGPGGSVGPPPDSLDAAGRLIGQVVARLPGSLTLRLRAPSALAELPPLQLPFLPWQGSSLAIVQGPGGGRAGQVWPQAPRVAVLDDLGRQVSLGADSSATITLELPAAQGPLEGGIALPAVAGLADFTAAGLHCGRAGSVGPLRASAVLAGREVYIDGGTWQMLAGAAVNLAFAAPPTAVAGGQPWQPAVQVVVQDAWQNTVTDGADATVVVSLGLAAAAPSGPVGAAPPGLTGSAAQAAVGGVASFPGLAPTGAGAGQQLVARANLTSGPSSALSGPFAVSIGAPASLAFVVGPPPVSALGSPFAAPLVVGVADLGGNLVPSAVAAALADGQVALALQPPADAGLLAGRLQAPLLAGRADFTGSGLQITAAAAGLRLAALATPTGWSGLSAPFAAVAGQASQIAFVALPVGADHLNPWPTPVVVQIQDAVGQPVTQGPDASSVLSLSLADPAEPLLGPTSQTAVAGRASFAGLHSGAAGMLVLRADKPDNSGLRGDGRRGSAAVSSDSAAFAVAGGAPSALVVAASPGPGVAGETAVPSLALELRDADGHRVASGAAAQSPVTLSVPGGASGPLTMAATAGRASFATTTFTQAGADLIGTASCLVPSGSALSCSFTVAARQPAAAGGLIFAVPPVECHIGQIWPTAPQVAVVDAFNNPIGDDGSADAQMALELRLSVGTGELKGARFRRAQQGLADFTGGLLHIDRVGDPKRLEARGQLASGRPVRGTSPPFAVVGGRAVRLAFVQQAQLAQAAQAFGVQPAVQIYDAQDNPVIDLPDGAAQVTFDHLAGPGALAGQTSVDAVQGRATAVDLSLATAATDHRLQATKADNTSVAGGSGQLTATGGLFAVAAGTATHLAWQLSPAASTAGELLAGSPLQVVICDAWNNVVTSGADSVCSVQVAAETGAPLAGAIAVTANNGVATFGDLRLAASAAGQRLRASASLGQAGAQSVFSAPFGVAAAAADHLTFIAQPAGSQRGQLLSPQPAVQIFDRFGNPVAGGSDAGATITLALPPGEGPLSGTAAQACAGGMAQWADLSVAVPGSRQLIAQASLVEGPLQATSSAFAVGAGAPFTGVWGFDVGDEGNYLTAGAQVAVQGGQASLVAEACGDVAAAGFAAGQGVGVAYDAAAGSLGLGLGGGCDGRSANCSPLDVAWLPRADQLLGAWSLTLAANSGGALADGDALAGAVGPPWRAHNANHSGLAAVAGKVGDALQLDGIDDYLQLDLGALQATSLSCAAWVNLGASGQPETVWWVGPAAGSGGAELELGVDGDGRWRARLGRGAADAGVVARGSQAEGQGWAHLVATADGQRLRLFVDGALAAEAAAPAALAAASWGAAMLGASPRLTSAGEAPLAGILDEAALWTTALEASQVAHIYRRQAPPRAGSLRSQVFDALADATPWQSLRWRTPLPTGKPLPFAGGNDDGGDYPGLIAGLAAGQVALWPLGEPHGPWRDVSAAPAPADLQMQGSLPLGPGGAGPLGPAIFFDGAASGAWLQAAAPLPAAAQWTVQAWFRAPAAQGAVAGGPLWGAAAGSAAGDDADALLYLSRVQDLVFGIDLSHLGGGQTVVRGGSQLADGLWHHAVARLSSDGQALFVDGVKVACAASSTTDSGQPRLPRLAFAGANLAAAGWPDVGGDSLAGGLAEVAMWQRPLADAEIAQLWLRGGVGLGLRVRSCQQASCADAPPWRGPDGSPDSFYSELPEAGTSAPALGGPEVTLGVSPGRYLQYEALLTGDDVHARCVDAASGSPKNCTPQLSQVGFSPSYRDPDCPWVRTLQGMAYTHLDQLTVSFGAAGCAAGVGLTLSADGSHWYYYDGTGWQPSNNSVAQSTDASALSPAAMAAFAGTAGPGNLQVTAFLRSDGQEACALDQISVQGSL